MNHETFNKLSLVAQYDDMCRTLNKLIRESADEEEACINMLETLQKRWETRQRNHDKEKESLKSQISSLEKEIKKLNRQLVESRSALVREADEKKVVAREKSALLEQIRQVRQLVEKDTFGDTDAHRRRVIKCLDIERLSTIASDDSDDCVSGLDYDRTEDDILDTGRSPRHSRKSGAAFENILENLHQHEQPTLLYRFLDKDKNSDEHLEANHDRDEHRRSARLTSKQLRSDKSSSNCITSGTSSNQTSLKMADLNLDTDSQTDEDRIEHYRQQFKEIEDAKREKMAATISTPNIKGQKRGATLSGNPTATMLKSLSAVNTPVANSHKPHTFVSKKSHLMNETCVPCGGMIRFYTSCAKCEVCRIVCHPDCREKCPLPCVKITAPNTRSRQKKLLISDYVNSEAQPKVPALIVHCCNEIEKSENIKRAGLYSASARVNDVEDLMSKILKSKSGMPNLSNVDVEILTGVVKKFLMQLDESLITSTLWSLFADALKLDIMEAKTRMIYYIGYDLPAANRDTIAFLMQHLHAVARHANDNMMSHKNLAKAFGPIIVGSSTRPPPTDPDQVRREVRIQVKILEMLFQVDEDYWTIYAPRMPSEQTNQGATSSFGSRLLAESPANHRNTRSRASRLGGGTLPTPKLKPLFS